MKKLEIILGKRLPSLLGNIKCSFEIDDYSFRVIGVFPVMSFFQKYSACANTVLRMQQKQ